MQEVQSELDENEKGLHNFYFSAFFDKEFRVSAASDFIFVLCSILWFLTDLLTTYGTICYCFIGLSNIPGKFIRTYGFKWVADLICCG